MLFSAVADDYRVVRDVSFGTHSPAASFRQGRGDNRTTFKTEASLAEAGPKQGFTCAIATPQSLLIQYSRLLAALDGLVRKTAGPLRRMNTMFPSRAVRMKPFSINRTTPSTIGYRIEANLNAAVL